MCGFPNSEVIKRWEKMKAKVGEKKFTHILSYISYHIDTCL